MKFSTATLVGLVASAPFGAQAFQPVRTLSPAAAAATAAASSTSLFSTAEKKDQSSGMSKKKEDRLNFMKSERFHRRGFKEVRDGVESAIGQQYQSELVNDLKTSNYVIEKDGVKVYLAKVRQCLFRGPYYR